jgi:hypothetical protein
MVGGTAKNAINKLGEAQIQAFIRKAKAGMANKTKLADGYGMKEAADSSLLVEGSSLPSGYGQDQSSDQGRTIVK